MKKTVGINKYYDIFKFSNETAASHQCKILFWNMIA